MDLYRTSETNELIEACRLHNDEAFDELVQRYTPMMRKVVNGFGRPAHEYDELFSEACVALHLAAQKYDLTQSEVTFGLYARICVRNRIVDLLRVADSAHASGEIDIEQLADEDSVEKRIVDRETFDGLLTSARALLSEYEYRVLLLHIQGYKTAAIAKALDRSAKSVDNAKARLFRRLRAEIGSISDF
ncbi:MAG: sigma-70 family RNA polymerase sigma factor [Clostridia bacterium]|nr:sigma-70 family RNA polymerase sigma factor [Clostridia bacterium]